MNKEEVLVEIEKVLPKLKQWMQYKNISLDNGDRITISKILNTILPDKKQILLAQDA